MFRSDHWLVEGLLFFHHVPMSFWAYMLHCRGGYFYVGHTDDLERRVEQHHAGEVAGFAVEHNPVQLVWSQAFASRDEALNAERRVKGWSSAKKMALIREDWASISRLSKGKDRASTGSARTEADNAHNANSVRPELVEGLPLLLHPQTASAVGTLETALELQSSGALSVRYELLCHPGGIVVPPPRSPIRTDGLWQTTCFELFVADADGYREFNFSPSGQWAAYRFTGYREGMKPLDIPAPTIELEQCGERLSLTVTLDASALPPMPWKIGLSAVIEEQDGAKCYWALAHPPGKPDFHHPACFAVELPAPKAS